MSRFLNTKLFLSLLVTSVVVSGCGKDDSAPATSTSLVSDNSILQYVPADSPYVFAAIEPMPDDLMDKIEPRMDEILRSYQVVLREIVAMKRAESGIQQSMDPEQMEKVDAFVEELTGLLSIEGIRSAGIERGGAMAFYGNGLLPVIRFELGDSALFDAAIARLEEQAQYSLPVAAIEGGGYRYIDGDEVRFIIAILENQAVITLVPGELDDEGIAGALGLALPETSIAESGALQEIAGHYGFKSNLLGFIDLQAIAAALISPQGINAQLMSAADGGPADLSDVCKAEIGEMVGIMPRIVVGYDEITADRLSSTVSMEIREDLASELSRLTAPVPGLGTDPGGLMAFGMSLDIQAARDFAESRIEAMKTDPYECELFAELQAGTAGVEQALAQPVPPIVNDFKGFLAVVEELEGLDLETQTPPSSVTGQFLLALDNAPTLVAMGAMFSPEIAGLNLQPDGVPVPLALSQMQAMGMTAFAALTESALAIAVGDDPEDDLAAMLGAKVGESVPFMSFSMDSARYYAFIGDAIATAETEDGETAPSPAMQAALRDIMNSVGSLYERMAVNVYFTANGIEFKSIQDIAD